MSLLLAFLISAAIGGITLGITIVLLRRQRRQTERLLTEFGSQQLITNKRLTEILLQHQKRAKGTEAMVETLKMLVENGRRDNDYALKQTEFLMRFTGALDAAMDATGAVAAEDDEIAALKPVGRPKWVN